MVGKIPSEIPILDLSIVSGKYEDLDNSAFEKIGEEFGKAMSTVGFAYIVNHGFDMEKIEHIHKLSKQFYDLSTSVKNKYRKTNPAECYHGYAGPGDELLNENEKNSTELREFFDIWGFQQYDEKNFPKEVPHYKAAFDACRPELNNLAKKLLRALGKFLKPMGLDDEEHFVKTHSFMNDPKIRTQAQFRTLHYYQMEPNDASIPPNAIRCGEHCDWGTITLLFQDLVGGLEVRRVDGTWIDAVPIKGSILINAGQLLELECAGIFKATPHRVRIVDAERTRKMARQSFIYFVNPDGDHMVKPVVPCPPGDKEYLKKPPKHAYNHYKSLIADSTNHY